MCVLFVCDVCVYCVYVCMVYVCDVCVYLHVYVCMVCVCVYTHEFRCSESLEESDTPELVTGGCEQPGLPLSISSPQVEAL